MEREENNALQQAGFKLSISWVIGMSSTTAQWSADVEFCEKKKKRKREKIKNLTRRAPYALFLIKVLPTKIALSPLVAAKNWLISSEGITLSLPVY